MKKILIIPSWYPSKESTLVGSFFEEQARFLHSMGFDIRVLYLLQSRKKSKPGFFRKRKQDTVSFEKTGGGPETWLGKQVVFDIASQQQGIEKLVNGYKTGWEKVTRDGWVPDLIHAQSTVNGGIVSCRLGKEYGIPFMITEHIPLYFYNRKTYEDNAIVEALESASSLGFVSHHLMRHILMQNVNVRPKIVGNLIDENKFPMQKKGVAKPFRIVTLAYPAFIKDLDTFFSAVRHLSLHSELTFEVVVVGNENYSESPSASTAASEAIAAKYGVSEKCNFIPFIRRSEMAPFLSMADVYVCTSISETFGVSPREAMMCGVPVISTKNGGTEDVITSENGMLVNLKDYEGIADRIIQIAAGKITFDPARIRQSVISQSGRAAFFAVMKDFYYF